MSIKLDNEPIRPEDAIMIIAKSGQSLMTAMVTLRASGEIEYGPGYTPDEAAKLLWEAVARHIPSHLRPTTGIQ